MIRNSLLRHVLCVNILGTLYSGVFIFSDFTENHTEFTSLIKHCALYLLVTNALLVLFSPYRWLWNIVWVTLCIVTSFALYFTSIYGAEINNDTLKVFFQATPREVDSFVSFGMVPYLMVGVILGIFGVWFMNKARVHAKLIGHRGLFIIIFVCLASICYAYSLLRPSHYLPYNILFGSYDYWQYVKDFDQVMQRRRNIGKKAGKFYNPAKNPLVIVLVIGESARADHFSLNGYARETNPLLSKVKNLINFPFTTSCGVVSMVSVPCLLTRATKKNKHAIKNETSIVSVFDALGFKTAWFGGQGAFSVRDPISYVSKEAKTYEVLSHSAGGKRPYDHELLPYLSRQIEQSKDNHFIVLHSTGSHYPYINNYTDSFAVFKPECSGDDSSRYTSYEILTRFMASGIHQDGRGRKLSAFYRKCFNAGSLINTYDNTIVYTDWFLHEIITMLKDRNALLVYVSDHGESLGENGKFLHSNRRERSNWHVPMIWWVSDEFISSNAAKIKTLQSKAMTKSSHDNIFHSLMDCIGVNSELINKRLSLCY